MTEVQYKRKLAECMEYAEEHSDEEYFAQAAEVLEMLLCGMDYEESDD